MRTLKFKATGQRLVADGDLDGLIVGSKGYLKAAFTFDAAHDECRHLAVFTDRSGNKEHAVELDRYNTCIVPDGILTEHVFKVYVVSLKKDYRIQTGKVTVRQYV